MISNHVKTRSAPVNTHQISDLLDIFTSASEFFQEKSLKAKPPAYRYSINSDLKTVALHSNYRLHTGQEGAHYIINSLIQNSLKTVFSLKFSEISVSYITETNSY